MEKTVLSSSYFLRFTSNTQKKHNNTIQKIYTIGWDEAVVLSFCVLFHYLNDPFFIFIFYLVLFYMIRFPCLFRCIKLMRRICSMIERGGLKSFLIHPSRILFSHDSKAIIQEEK